MAIPHSVELVRARGKAEASLLVAEQERYARRIGRWRPTHPARTFPMRCRTCLTAGLLAMLGFGFSGQSIARVLIPVSKPAQRMTVSVDGDALSSWPVSTGMRG